MTNVTENEALAAVLRNQVEIKAVEATIIRVEQAIRENEKTIAEADVPADELDHRRQDVLAKVALGTASPGDLAGIDAEVAKREEAKRAAEKKIIPAREAIEGLRRREGQERLVLKRLADAHEVVRQTFLSDLLEAHGSKYRELADALHDEFAHLVAINAMLDGNTLGISQSTRYSIPTLRLKVFEGERGRPHLHHMDQLAAPGTGAALRAAEVERLRNMGVEL